MLEMLLAALLAVIVASVLVSLRPRDGAPAIVLFVFFFAMSFPLIWAGGLWMAPAGAVAGGVSWLGFVFVSLFLLLLILAAVPTQRKGMRERALAPKNARHEVLAGTAIFFGLYFWLLLVAAAAALIAHYIR